MNRLQGLTALITGGSGGIGLACRTRLESEGATVLVWDLDGDSGSQGFSKVDLRDASSIARAASGISSLDILVHCAGVTRGWVSLEEMSPSIWQEVIDVNLRGTMLVTQSLLPRLESSGRGRIITLTSILGRYGFPGQTSYAASKSGIIGMTRVWARELASSGITSNAVAPGYIRTGMNSLNGPAVEREVVARTPLGRIGEPEEVAAVVAFLASADASFVNGAVIPVDGGFVP